MTVPVLDMDIEIQGGASRLILDFLQGNLISLRNAGGLNEGTLRLARPTGEVALRAAGGVRKLVVERPAGSAIGVHLLQGGSRLALDGLRLGSVGGELQWESEDFSAASGCYRLEVIGGAGELTVTTAIGDEQAGPQHTGDEPSRNDAKLLGASLQEYPTVAEVLPRLIGPTTDHRFEFGIQILLDGLERRLACSAENPSSRTL